MSKLARCVVWTIAVAEVPLQVLLYRHYRDVVDGQAVLANVFGLFYGVVAVGIVWVIDKLARLWRTRRV